MVSFVGRSMGVDRVFFPALAIRSSLEFSVLVFTDRSIVARDDVRAGVVATWSETAGYCFSWCVARGSRALVWGTWQPLVRAAALSTTRCLVLRLQVGLADARSHASASWCILPVFVLPVSSDYSAHG